jgi:hypothetical protein
VVPNPKLIFKKCLDDSQLIVRFKFVWLVFGEGPINLKLKKEE